MPRSLSPLAVAGTLLVVLPASRAAPANHLPTIRCSLPPGFELQLTATAPPRPDHFTITVRDVDGDPVSATLLNPPPKSVFVPLF